MNKQQIIAPLVLMGIVALLALFCHARRQHDNYLQMRAMGIGHDLSATTNSTAVVYLGASLSQALGELHRTPVTVHRVQLGGFGPTDDQAKVSVFLTNQSGMCLGIRLRPDAKSDQFHVLGYWTESSAPFP